LSSSPDAVIAVEHQDPQLVILAAIITGKGFFLAETPNKELMQQNLVINDVFPWANFVSISDLYNSKAYHVLITSNPEALEILSERSDLAIVIELTQPVQVISSRLMKMAVYKIQDA
jgi:predicted choloylglycine hydrolase